VENNTSHTLNTEGHVTLTVIRPKTKELLSTDHICFQILCGASVCCQKDIHSWVCYFRCGIYTSCYFNVLYKM